MALSPFRPGLDGNAVLVHIIDRQEPILVKNLARNVMGLVKEGTSYIAENAFTSTLEVARVILSNAIALEHGQHGGGEGFIRRLTDIILELTQDKSGRAL